ncbi:MAG: hypothetical protein JOZ47_10325 [Kutzneria sp.]|nr:hypothetical protein [Kutzneria sp.]
MATRNQEKNAGKVDLTVDAKTFSAPGSGKLSIDKGAPQAKGPVTLGTTCWGTPCPSANTISC